MFSCSLLWQVVVLQVYANDSDMPIEAKYVFPLDEQAAVCGFEAFINDKHIVGEVKEKETAHREYKEAISQGHGAYLMDEEKPVGHSSKVNCCTCRWSFERVEAREFKSVYDRIV